MLQQFCWLQYITHDIYLTQFYIYKRRNNTKTQNAQNVKQTQKTNINEYNKT